MTLLFLAALTACGDDSGAVDSGATRLDAGRRDASAAMDAGSEDAGRPDAGSDAGFDAGFDAGPRDAGPPPDAGDPRWPVDPALADCLGLTDPVCAGCHHRVGVWYLRPAGVPPPPPGMPPPPWEECGLEPP
jgi:hypothetical protein